MKRFISYFFQGLLFIFPIAVTLYVIYKLFAIVDGLLPFDSPFGVGLVLNIAIITFIGYLGSRIIAQPFFRFFEKIFEKAPLVKVIYTSVKDLLSAFVGKDKRFNRPVLVKVSNESNLHKLGFITNDDLKNIGLGADKVAVYLPHSYNFSGNLFIVPRENITFLNASPSVIMKFIISGGVTAIESEK